MTSFRIEKTIFQETIIQVQTYNPTVGSSIVFSPAVLSEPVIDMSSGSDATANVGNVSIGTQPVENIANFNTSVGLQTLAKNTASNNVGVGVLALSNNTDGAGNTAVGSYSLAENNGHANTAIGFSSLPNATEGNNNTAVGNFTGSSLRTGKDNIVVGSFSDVFDEDSSNQIIIGNNVKGMASDQIILGNPFIKSCFVAGIRLSDIEDTSLLNVYVNRQGQLTTISSSSKGKDNILTLSDETDKLYELRPVSFNYSVDGRKSFGLITDDVEEVFPDILAREEIGSLKTVQYHLLIPLMLNMIIRLKKQVDVQKDQIGRMNDVLKGSFE